MIPPVGPVPARFMLVGEAPGEQEVLRREPFVGASGQELNRMLHEAGILRSECFITNVARERPPANDIELWVPKTKADQAKFTHTFRGRRIAPPVAQGLELLTRELEMVQPKVVIAFGNVSMWALTGRWGIKSWRGSLLKCDGYISDATVIPAYHPAYILRDWSARAITVRDLRRAQKEASDGGVTRPRYEFVIRPHFDEVIAKLDWLEKRDGHISVDIETRAGHIACVGLAWSATEAICIPLMCVENKSGYWSEIEEVEIVFRLSRLLSTKRIIGQNFIYDTQYFWRHFGMCPAFERDTMLGHHTAFAGTPKGLDYLRSLYCDYHVYWKDDGKNWEPRVGEDQLWSYNCEDAVVTYEVDGHIQETIDKLGLREQHDFQMQMFWPVLEAMIRGVRVDTKQRGELALELSSEIAARESWFQEVLGHPLNPRSPKQMKELFYGDLAQKEIFSRKTGQITLDDEALRKISVREPLLKPLVRRIGEHRSLGVFLSTFISAPLGQDGRLHCSYNIAGTETFRLSSSEDAFGSGLNLQNIPEGGLESEEDPDSLRLPNIRRLFIPDPGFTFFDGDLDRADLQVVAWEAEDDDLKAALRAHLDMHLHSARAVYDLPISDDELKEDHPNYKEVKAKYYHQRQNVRQVVHATNYVGSARTVAAQFGLTVHETEKFQSKWFALHPGIKAWHQRVISALQTKRCVQNRFGYRRYYFDRIESIVPEAVAWIPQSTVAHYINRIWLACYRTLPQVQILMQVHDSLNGQVPTHMKDHLLRELTKLAGQVIVPYDDPLVIPFRIKTSEVSWGDCK